MKLSWKVYAVLVFVFISSILISLFLPSTKILRNISAFPAVASLIGALYQIFRDQAKFEKQLRLQQEQNYFTLGAASHMANTAFDKHVEFCEEYITQMHKIVSDLFKKGPSPEALDHAADLYKIQQKYTTWLTPDISNHISKFQQALSDIGADSGLVRDLRGTGDPGRGPAINRMYSVFKDVIEIDKKEDEEVNKEVAVNTIINKLRAVLGIEELTLLRQNLISSSVKSLRKC